MPVIINKTYLDKLLTQQHSCKLCEEESTRSKYKVVCDICEMWTCLDCAEVSVELYELANRTNSKLNFVCDPCETNLPKVRDLIIIQQKQQQTIEDISNLKVEVAANTTSITKQTEDSVEIKRRLVKVEEALKQNKLYDQFPTLPTHQQHLTELQADFTNQKRETYALTVSLKKQQEDQEELKSREAKKPSLIVYGMPETHEDEVNQIKSDFNTIKQLYATRVDINKEDFNAISRLGVKKPNQVRPIKITFTSMEKRMKVLTKNKGLRLDEDGENTCGYADCSTHPTKHTHIYITTDKTRKEREEEQRLRQELKERRGAGEEDIIIRNGKIVKRETRQNAHPRWAEVSIHV